MSVLFYVSRKLRTFGRPKKKYPFQLVSLHGAIGIQAKAKASPTISGLAALTAKSSVSIHTSGGLSVVGPPLAPGRAQGVLVYVSRKLRIFPYRPRKRYPFQFQQVGIASPRGGVYFKRKAPLRNGGRIAPRRYPFPPAAGFLTAIAAIRVRTSSAGIYLTALAARPSLAARTSAGAVYPAHLAATPQVEIKAQAGFSSLKTSLAGSASVSTRVLAAIGGKTALVGSASIKAFAKAAMSPLALMAVKTLIALRAAASAASKTILSGATRIAVSALLVKPGAVALIATAFVKASARLPLIVVTSLTAATSTAVRTTSAYSAAMSLSGATRIVTSAAATVNRQVHLAAVSAVKTSARLAISAATDLASLSASTLVAVRSSASLGGQVALSASSAVATFARAPLKAATQIAALAGVTRLAAFLQAAVSVVFPSTAPAVNALYPRLVQIFRAETVAGSSDQIGGVGYSGMSENPAGSDPQGEISIAVNVPASIQATQQGRKKDSSLPSDAVWSPTWVIYIPQSALTKGLVRDRDIIYDDEGYRYEVGQAYWNILGYKMTCIRLEG